MRTYKRKKPAHQLIEDVHELCRLCLSKADAVVPIFTEEQDNVCAVLALRITICVGLENLPNTTDANNAEIGVSIQTSEEVVQDTDIQEPDITTFLTAVLLQLGMLTQQDNGLVLTEQNIKSLDVETGDGSQVTFELVEEDDAENVLEESIVLEHPLEPTQDLNSSQQNDVVIKHVNPDYAITNPIVENKKVVVDKKTNTAEKKGNADDNKKNDAWCDECGKQLATRSALYRHRRIHSGEKPYTCQHCGRKFSQKEILRRHTYIHEDRRPYACEVCNKSFTQRSALMAHARAHAPPHARTLALHRCARCPKVFLYASGLSRHMMIHSGRTYVCGACDRQFKDKSSLMRHFKNTNHTPNGTATV